MKKIFQKLTLFCLSVCSLFLTFSCGMQSTDTGEIIRCATLDPEEDISKYTEDEHRFRIKEKLEEIYADWIKYNLLLAIEVEILYSLDYNQPRYFLVDYTLASDTPELRYQHIVGAILYDVYYLRVEGYLCETHLIRSPIRTLGYEKVKKYFGGCILAVETENGDFLQIYNSSNKSCEQKILSRDKCKQLGLWGVLPSFQPLGYNQHIQISGMDAYYLRMMTNPDENIYGDFGY